LKSESQTRLLAILLAVVTLAAVGLSVANLVQENTHVAPTDGAHLSETSGGTISGLRAYIVPKNSPAHRAGIRAGDIVTAIDDVPTTHVATAEREIASIGIWSKATYTVVRKVNGEKPATLQIAVILEPTDLTDNSVLRLIALVYLAIGLYVLFRRWTAPKATHFYVFCLASYVLCAFKYSGVLDGLDQTVLWCNIAAMALQPALFLHFALSFSEDPQLRRGLKYLYALLYLPGVLLMILRYRALEVWSPTGLLLHRLDQTDYAYLAAYYVAAALVFWVRYRSEQQPLQRQQLKWLSRGTMLTVTPFTLLYVIPFLSDANVPPTLARVALLSLIFLPLTFSWAIVRYRLMDVDLIFKRGVTYTLATAALVGLYFGVIALAASTARARLQNFGFWGLAAAVILTGILFDPLKRAIQARVDRLFEQKRIDYRETLIKFGRELNAQTDLATLVGLIIERLPETLLLTRVAVFLADDEAPRHGEHFRLIAQHGLSATAASATEAYDLGFLDFDRRGADTHLFFDSPQNALRLPESQRLTAAALDLNYYVPCRAARSEGAGLRTIAVLGLGRTGDGDFLSSEDVELLESLAAYIGIAIQNAQLYRKLEQKIFDFERLRDFNENIVESINIGVFAVDLEDHIESWNTQMEVMYATPRAEALRRPLREVFPEDFMTEFDRLRSEAGICTLYKFRLPTPAGEARTANITIAPLLNRDFAAVGRIVIVDDITDTVNMEKQLTQSEKLSSIGLLAAGVAHEVNTPLAVISSYAQMLGKQLRADDATSERLRPVLEKITQQTFRASEIVNGLLNFARMGSVDFARVDVNAMLRDTLILLEHSLRSSRIVLQAELAPALPPISGNLGKLQQVAVNLIMNAKDALQDSGGGTIRLSTAQTLRGVELRLEDNGEGIPPEVLAKIYDPFFTTKTNPKEGQRKGTGLGLAVTYGIVQEHGGTIHVMSTVGKGTVFTVTLPALEVAARSSAIELEAKAGEGNAVHV
jgi:two-component system NtrC family sensor kinase